VRGRRIAARSRFDVIRRRPLPASGRRAGRERL